MKMMKKCAKRKRSVSKLEKLFKCLPKYAKIDEVRQNSWVSLLKLEVV